MYIYIEREYKAVIFRRRKILTKGNDHKNLFLLSFFRNILVLHIFKPNMQYAKEQTDVLNIYL